MRRPPARSLALGCLAGTLLANAPAFAEIIDFEDLAPGTEATNQYEASHRIRFEGDTPHIESLPGYAGGHFLCSGQDCLGDLAVSWSRPVVTLGFDIIGDEVAGSVGKIDLFFNGEYSTTVNLWVDGDQATVDEFGVGLPVDVYGPTEGFTSIRLYGLANSGGLGWDNFRYAFSPEEPAANVPEPGNAWLLGAGLALLGLRARKRNQPH